MLWKALFLIAAGTAAGLSGTIAGISSIWSYPALLALGLTPIDANITNSVSLAALGLSAVRSSKPEWEKYKNIYRKLSIATFFGGICGAFFLIITPNSTFKIVIPYLIILASLMIWIPVKNDFQYHKFKKFIWVISFLVGIYAGYFGAGAGLIIVLMLMHFMNLNIFSAQAVKNIGVAVANTMAAIIFLFSGHVHWLATIPLSIGFMIGGHFGPKLIRKINQNIAKSIVCLMGISLAVFLIATN
jgi:uncharacterized membrane protein YfcA